MYYKTLVFEPLLQNKTKFDNILWKAQVSAPDGYSSLTLILLKDLIELNNRRSLNEWHAILKDNSLKWTLNYDHAHCKEFIIEEKNLIAYPLQIFACDIEVTNNKIEVSSKYSLSLLHVLNIDKEGILNPVALSRKVLSGLELLAVQIPDANNLVMMGILKSLDKLAELCISYEVDVKYDLVEN
jgi:hypothetical protein